MTNPIQASLTVQLRLRVALGTFVSIEAQAANDALALQAIDAAFAAVLEVQRLMHPARGADLAELNVLPPGARLKVHRWTWEVLDLCRQLHEASHGTFDPCLDVAEGRMSDVQVLPDHSVTLRAPVHLDLGGIAKGYAVDRAIDALRAQHCSAGLVNAGGDLAVFGARGQEIACGHGAGSAMLVELRNAALATSEAGTGASLPGAGPPGALQARPPEHRGYYDGRGRRSDISGKATVIAPRAALADGLTKCVLAAPRGSSAVLLESFGAHRLKYPNAQKASPRPRSKRVKSLL